MSKIQLIFSFIQQFRAANHGQYEKNIFDFMPNYQINVIFFQKNWSQLDCQHLVFVGRDVLSEFGKRR